MKTFPLNQPNNEISLFYNQIGESIEFILNNYEKNNLNNAITILKTYYSENAEYIDRYLPSLIKLLQVKYFDNNFYNTYFIFRNW